jgi:hypothetical protein
VGRQPHGGRDARPRRTQFGAGNAPPADALRTGLRQPDLTLRRQPPFAPTRAAGHTLNKYELDYSIDEKLSNDMWQVLDTIFDSRATHTGEATLEFLVALALKRLKLETKDLNKLKAKFGSAMEYPIARTMWTIIGEHDG